MKKLKIYNSETGTEWPIDKILKIMTDNWIDDYASGHTVSDLRDACKELLDWKKRVEVAANEFIDAYKGDGICRQAMDKLERELGE